MIDRVDVSVYSKEILPATVLFSLLIAGTLLIDLLLHFFNIYFVGRYLGIAGTLLIIFSFAYSLRKRKLITKGAPKTLLNLHESLAWLGSLLILVHAGVHFNAVLPWIATFAMLVNVASGLTGQILLARCKSHVEERRTNLKTQGVVQAEIDKTLFWDAVALDTMKKWRQVHFPITLAFATLGTIHIISILFFWNWK